MTNHELSLLSKLSAKGNLKRFSSMRMSQRLKKWDHHRSSLKLVSFILLFCFVLSQTGFAQSASTLTTSSSEVTSKKVSEIKPSGLTTSNTSAVTHTALDTALGFVAKSLSLSTSTSSSRVLGNIPVSSGSSNVQKSGNIKLAALPENPASSDPNASRVTATYTFDPSLLKPGQAYARDSLSSDWTNTAGKIVDNNYWTASPEKYFVPNNPNQFIVATKAVARDEEVDTWIRNGVVILRMTENGGGIFFRQNLEVPGGELIVGIVTEGGEKSIDQGNYYKLFHTKDIASIAPEYKRFDTDGDYFTYGADGFDIYVKYNGKEILRFQDYRHMADGKVAIKGLGEGYGLRKVTARFERSRDLYSDYKNNVLDLRDFGLREAQSLGAATKGSNQIRLSSSSSFKKGDYVIVEVGAEAGQGKQGTVGVGGVWPAKSYADASIRNLDQSQSINTHAWTENDSVVAQWTGTKWQPVDSGNYYFKRSVPLALKAKILDISSDGLTLTLDAVAQADVSNAQVFLDNSYVINKLGMSPAMGGEINFPDAVDADYGYILTKVTPNDVTLKIPAGKYAVGEEVRIADHSGWKLVGESSDKTVLFSPKGARSASITFYRSPNGSVSDLHLMGNAGDDGYGINVTQRKAAYSSSVTQTNIPQDSSIPSGVLFMLGSHGSTAKNLKVTDVFQRALGVSFSNDVWAENINVELSYEQKAYLGWQVQWSDAVGGGCVNCSINSYKMATGFQSFKSTGTQFINCKGVNIGWAMNTAGNFLIKDSMVRILENAQGAFGSFSKWNPIIGINTNIGLGPYASQGGTLSNVSIVQEGYSNSSKDIFIGINIGGDNPNINIIGGSYSSPDYQSPSELHGALAINSSGKNTTVDGFSAFGKVSTRANPPYGNITVSNGVVKNSIADAIRPGVALKQDNNRPASNKAPVIGAIQNQNIDEGQVVTVDVGTLVTDANNSTNDTLNVNQSFTYSLDGTIPDGASIDAKTGLFSWTPSEAQGPATYPIVVKVTDSGNPPLSATKTFNVTVKEVNLGPIVEPIIDQNLNEGQTFSLQVTAKDTDVPTQKLSYQLGVDAPTGMTIDNNGLINWAPLADQGRADPYLVKVTVLDNGLDSKSQDIFFNVRVKDTIQPPKVAPITDKNIVEGESLNFQVDATNTEGVPMASLSVTSRKNADVGNVVRVASVSSPAASSFSVFSLEPGSPEGALIDSESGEFTWRPEKNDGGKTYAFKVRVTDTTVYPGLYTIVSFNVFVAKNQLPTIARIPDQSVLAGTTLTFQPLIQDVNVPPQKLTCSFDANTAPRGISVDENTGIISWTPSIDQARTQPYEVNLLVSDGVDTVSVPIKISITSPIESKPPVMVSANLVNGVGFQIVWRAEPEQSYILESTKDFSNWTQEKTVIADQNGLVTFIDNSGLPLRFYRLVKKV